MGTILRAISVLLVAWFTFMIGAAIYAAMKRRDVAPPDPDADEVDLVASFGPLEFHSESGAFRGGIGDRRCSAAARSTCATRRSIRWAPRSRSRRCSAAATWSSRRSGTSRRSSAGSAASATGVPRATDSPEAPTLRVEGTDLFGGWGITSDAGNEEETLPEPVTVSPVRVAPGGGRRAVDARRGNASPRRTRRRYRRSS